MTPQEAKKELMHINLILAHQMDLARAEKEKDMLNRNYQANNIAISALEKQIPKKPTDICAPVITWGVCPICKGELNKLGGRANRVFESNAFCPDCGQALDWGDE